MISNRFCAIPISILVASPFNLVQGDPVNARVIATNFIGNSEYSESSANNILQGALIQGAPLTPIVGLFGGPMTTTSQIDIRVNGLTGVATGGAAIISYEFDYDKNTN